MEVEPLAEIKSQEVFEAVSGGKLIEHYEDDEPYPSCLIFGRTKNDRPIHVVCAYDEVDELTIVVTVYEPSTDKWINFEKRRK